MYKWKLTNLNIYIDSIWLIEKNNKNRIHWKRYPINLLLLSIDFIKICRIIYIISYFIKITYFFLNLFFRHQNRKYSSFCFIWYNRMTYWMNWWLSFISLNCLSCCRNRSFWTNDFCWWSNSSIIRWNTSNVIIH